MAGNGPPPKTGAKARRNKDTVQPTTIRFEHAEQPELPGTIDWCQETMHWWAKWGESAQAEHFTLTDWDFLLDTALLHNEVWGKGALNMLGELRLRVAKFGATPEDRVRLRMTFAEAGKLDEEGEAKPSSARERRAGLRVVHKDVG